VQLVNNGDKMMKDFNLIKNINGAIAPGREHSFAPWNVSCNTSFKSKEVHNVKNESGRSMIEMLGVLAIIGVLSVGGIAGYSKAMQKYKINKTIEQITLIAGNIRSFFAPQRNYEGLGYCIDTNSASDDYKANCKLIKKAKLMPDEMWDDTDKQFYNVFGGNVFLSTAHKSSNTDKQAFRIEYVLPKDEEVCIELASQDWSMANVSGIRIADVGAGVGGNITHPASIENIVDICSKAINSVAPSSMRIYFDVNSNCWDATKSNPNTCS